MGSFEADDGWSCAQPASHYRCVCAENYGYIVGTNDRPDYASAVIVIVIVARAAGPYDQGRCRRIQIHATRDIQCGRGRYRAV